MIYRCKACGNEEARGYLPVTSCGLMLVGLLGLSAICVGALSSAIHKWHEWIGIRSMPTIHWWAWPIMIAIGVVAAIAGVPLLYFIFSAIEWIVYCMRRCSVCGARRWSFGFTRGFGL
jgi:hypothetical protein